MESVVGPTMGWAKSDAEDDDESEKHQGVPKLLLVGAGVAALVLVAAVSHLVHRRLRARREEAEGRGEYAALPGAGV